MNGPILLVGTRDSTSKKIDEILKELGINNKKQNADLKIIDPEANKRSIGIKEAKEAVNFLNEKPFSSKNKALVVYSAEKLTEQAQNAFLKTLEELAKYATVILNVQKVDDLLETIQSRCKIIKVANKSEKNNVTIDKPNNILLMSTKNRFDWAQEAGKEDREVVIETLDQIVSFGAIGLMHKNHALNIENIQKTSEDLKNTNVNQKLALEKLAITLI